MKVLTLRAIQEAMRAAKRESNYSEAQEEMLRQWERCCEELADAIAAENFGFIKNEFLTECGVAL